jgi:hypothetical protein
MATYLINGQRRRINPRIVALVGQAQDPSVTEFFANPVNLEQITKSLQSSGQVNRALRQSRTVEPTVTLRHYRD